MTAVESPQSFIVRQECEKTAFQNGFRRKLDEQAGWAAFQSTTAPGVVYLAAASALGPWFIALDHRGVIEELDAPTVGMTGPGLARYACETLGGVYDLLPRIYQLAASLPDAPLREFESKVRDLPKTTEAERLIVQRVGQNIFRASLIDYWQGRCPLTGITDTALLRASHIVPWKDCSTDAERLDVHNGLLLSALWDAAFDRGLVTFDDKGQPLLSPALTDVARAELRWRDPISLTNNHRKQLAWHRANLFVTHAGG